MRASTAFLVLGLALAAGCRNGGGSPPPGPRTLYLTPSGADPEGQPPEDAAAVAFVEVAADDLARQHGLMGREYLRKDSGMIFMYPEDDVLTFWMKNTLIPLSIAFANSDGRIVRILEMEPDSGVPDVELPRYSSEVPAKYAIEMTAGWYALHGIREGDRLQLDPFFASVPVH